jgi:hypothetical protein
MTDDLIKRDDAHKLACLFHENYEALAPEYGYKTRDETKDFDPTTVNGQLMIATCSAVLSALPDINPAAIREAAWVEALDAAHEYTLTQYGMGFLKHPVDRERILALIGEKK